MIKCCKIIVVYFGHRNTVNLSPESPKNSLELFRDFVIPYEYKFYPKELEMDLILVNHLNGYKEGDEYLRTLSENKIHNGTIRVFEFENTGSPFTAYNEIWKLYKDKYEYYMFQEDDHIIIDSDYYSQSINQLNKDEKLKFISFAPITDYRKTHSGGGFGITKNIHLQHLADNNNVNGKGNLFFTGKDATYHEVEFTNCYVSLGGGLEYIQEFNPSPWNYTQHRSHNSFNVDRSKKWFYIVGQKGINSYEGK